MADSLTSRTKTNIHRSTLRSSNTTGTAKCLSFFQPKTAKNNSDDANSLAVAVDTGSAGADGSETSSIGMEWDQEKPRKWDPWLDGYVARPHVDMPNEVNFLGGLGPNVGHPRSTTHIQRPTAIQKVYNMRTGNRAVFTFCEDSRKANNVVQKKEKIDYRNVKRIRACVGRVRLAQNVATPPPSDFSEDPTEIFDEENPLNLDFQGMDHQQTYQRDEQELQNRREYFIQKRHMNKKQMIKLTLENFKVDKIQKDFCVPEQFDVNVVVPGDEDLQKESIVAQSIPWTDKYRLEKLEFEPKFQRPIPDAIPYVPPPSILAELTRTVDKVHNHKRSLEQTANCQQRLNEMQRLKQIKEETKLKLEKETAEEQAERQMFSIAENDFNRHFIDEFHDLEQSFANLPPIYQEQKYPHTLRETKYMRRQMNRSRRVIRDEISIRTEFDKKYVPYTTLNDMVEADDKSIDACELSEQSTDDEDGMSVGQKSDNQYQLRGFQYKLGDELRGLKDVKPKSKLERVPRSCITRKKWFDELAQIRRENPLFSNKSGSLPNKALPNDPDYLLYRCEIIQPKPITIAPVKEMIEQGEEPRIINAKVPKLKKPKSCKIRKFNLTAYIFGSQKRLKAKRLIMMDGETENKYGVSFDMIDKCDKLFKQKKNQNKAMRHNRMRALGIPIVEFGNREEENDEISSEGSDWVPEKSHDKNNVAEIYSTSNVPRFRETTHKLRTIRQTLKSNPSSALSQPSEVHSVKESAFQRSVENVESQTYDVPRLSKLASDIILPPNLNIKRTTFTDLFDCRHHHPHRDQTQHKPVYVKYLPKLPTFQPPPGKKERAAKMKPFQRANYRKGKPLREDLSMPKFNYDNSVLASDQLEINGKENNVQSADVVPSSLSCRSRSKIEAIPEKSAFRRLLNERHKAAVLETFPDAQPNKCSIDTDQFVERLKDEMNSIKSCNSSNTSSVCSNYTNDSGSYLQLEGVKVPCSYITKSQVPFEEIDRCRIIAGPVDKNDEYFGPYYAVPFAGQKMDMRQLSLPKDKFFTSGVRSRYGIRNRLFVNVPGFSKDQIGIKDQKRISQLATEWDSYYQNEIVARPRIRKFKPRTIMAQARDALRKKFVSDYIQEALIEKAVVQEKERKYAEEVLEFEKKCSPLFTQWTEKHYRKYMRKMQDVKPYYDLTAKLKNDLVVATNKFIRIEMSIIYIEDDWRRRTVMQNFHYLLSDPRWRLTNDWVHRKEDGSLENFQESIIKRPFTNVRARDKDSAWAIKEFYDKFFENEEARNVQIVFKDAREFMQGLQQLKMKTFVCLLEMHFAMWVLSNLQHGYNTFKDWATNYIERRDKFVKNRCAKKYFNEDLAADLQKSAQALQADPLHDAVAAPRLRVLLPLCENLFENIVPKEVRSNMKSGADTIDKFIIIVNMMNTLLGQLDEIPRDIRLLAERKVRSRRSFTARQSKRTFDLECRIQQTSIQMRKNLAPAYVRKPATHPLPRSVYVKKIIKKVAAPVEISEVDKLYLKAFTQDSTSLNLDFDQAGEKAAILRSLEANCIPFYFDVFLRQNQYFPSYDFKTEIELREGSEYTQFKYDDVLDNVQHNLRIWETNKQAIMDENIRRTWHLYASRTNP